VEDRNLSVGARRGRERVQHRRLACCANDLGFSVEGVGSRVSLVRKSVNFGSETNMSTVLRLGTCEGVANEHAEGQTHPHEHCTHPRKCWTHPSECAHAQGRVRHTHASVGHTQEGRGERRGQACEGVADEHDPRV